MFGLCIFLPTSQAFQIIRQAFAAFAGPADLPRGVSNNQGVVGNIFVDHRSSAYETISLQVTSDKF